MKIFRTLRKKLGIYNRKEIMTTYANATQHGRDIPKDITDEEMIEKGVKMMNEWVECLNKL